VEVTGVEPACGALSMTRGVHNLTPDEGASRLQPGGFSLFGASPYRPTEMNANTISVISP
jgi:hypothetical protein